VKTLIIINLVVLGAVVVALFLILDRATFLIFMAATVVLIASGSLTAYYWYQRGKVYEKRGESGPDG